MVLYSMNIIKKSMNIIIISIYHCRIPLAFLKQWGLRNYKSILLGLKAEEEEVWEVQRQQST